MEIKISPELPKFHENILDIFGASFMDHAKGIAEWLKNSIDAYIREREPDSNQIIILNFKSDNKKRAVSIIECVDFVGATFEEVDESLKIWGDPEAASRGKWISVYGGHGNGGKFYMRQMFQRSYFITYKDGHLTIFGFDKNKKYGFDNNFKGKRIDFHKALEIAEMPEHFFNIASDNQKQRRNFTVVRGISPKRMGKKGCHIDSIITSIIRSPQSRQILNRSKLSVFIDNKIKTNNLKPQKLSPRKGYEEPIKFKIPSLIVLDGISIKFPTRDDFIGELVLNTSENPFSKKRDDNILNCIDVIGKVGIIALYKMNELEVMNKVGADFIYGECRCPILEDKMVSCVQNDRSKLIENDYSIILLKWISEKIDGVALKIQGEEKDKGSELEKGITSYFNKLLHGWSQNFFKRYLVEIYGGPKEGSGFGGVGDDGYGRNNKGNKKLKKDPNVDKSKGGHGDKKIKKPKFPTVLVSGYDSDPITGDIFPLDPRQDIIYQRPEDVDNHIWWINAQKPFAKKILSEEGPQSSRWKEYLFQRYINIIINYMIEERWKVEPNADPTTIQQWIFETLNEIYHSAYQELENYLFE